MAPETLLLTAAGLLVAWRVEAALREMTRGRQVVHERELQLRERELALVEQRQTSALDPEEIPIDLAMRCNGETEPWAREQLRSLVQQLYGKHQHWDSVRTELMKLDMLSSSAETGWSITRVRT